MAQQGDRDDLDRDLPLNEEALNDEETRGMGDEELEEGEEGDEGDLEDEDKVDQNE
jgi:hypothetical protein